MEPQAIPAEALSASLNRVLKPEGLTIDNIHLLYLASRSVASKESESWSEPFAPKFYRFLSLSYASSDYEILIQTLRVVATLCHCEYLAMEMLLFESTTEGIDSTNNEFFPEFGFSVKHSPSDRLIILIQGLINYEVYNASQSLFHAAVLALEGLTFYSQGKKKVLLSGGLQTMSSTIRDLHTEIGFFDMKKTDSDLALSLWETLSNIITYRFARALALDNGDKILEQCATMLSDPLCHSLVTCLKSSHTYAITSCILPCLLESEFFYKHLAEDEQAITSLLNIAVSGRDAGNRAALLSLLVLSIDTADPNIVTKMALHGEVGEEAERAQAAAEAAFNEFRSRSPSPMRKLYNTKALLSTTAEERCEVILSVLHSLLSHEAYINISRTLEEILVNRYKVNDIFYGKKDALTAEIEYIRETVKDLLFSLCIDEAGNSLKDQYGSTNQAKSVPRSGGLAAIRSVPRPGAQSRLETRSTGKKPSAFRKAAEHMSIDLSKTLF